jgi:hypothetical protein
MKTIENHKIKNQLSIFWWWQAYINEFAGGTSPT